MSSASFAPDKAIVFVLHLWQALFVARDIEHGVMTSTDGPRQPATATPHVPTPHAAAMSGNAPSSARSAFPGSVKPRLDSTQIAPICTTLHAMWAPRRRPRPPVLCSRARAELAQGPAITDRSQLILASGRPDHSTRSTTRSTEIDKPSKFKSINVTELQKREPPVGIEPTTCSLRETRPPAPDALAAPIARPNAPIAHDAPDARPARSTTRSTVRPRQTRARQRTLVRYVRMSAPLTVASAGP